jgi:hypothetical protein
MFRLLTVVIASGFALGLTAAIGQTLDTGPQKTAGEYKMAKDPCKRPSEAGREQCAKDAKATEESSRMRCEKLTDQAKRECVLEAFVQQHDRMIAAGRIEKSEGAPPGGPQPR